MAMLDAALADVDNEYTFSMAELMRSEVEAGLLDQAAELLAKNYHRAAATLAGIVVEQHMRAIAKAHGVNTRPGGKPLSMGALNDALSKANAYDSNTQRQISLVVPIRNNAAHGGELTEKDAEYIVENAVEICARLK
jgi:hypothetical protein